MFVFLDGRSIHQTADATSSYRRVSRGQRPTRDVRRLPQRTSLPILQWQGDISPPLRTWKKTTLLQILSEERRPGLGASSLQTEHGAGQTDWSGKGVTPTGGEDRGGLMNQTIWEEGKTVFSSTGVDTVYGMILPIKTSILLSVNILIWQNSVFVKTKNDYVWIRFVIYWY